MESSLKLDDDARADAWPWEKRDPIAVRLTRIDLPFWHTVAVLTKLIIAATPALLIAGAFWGAIYLGALAVIAEFVGRQ